MQCNIHIYPHRLSLARSLSPVACAHPAYARATSTTTSTPKPIADHQPACTRTSGNIHTVRTECTRADPYKPIHTCIQTRSHTSIPPVYCWLLLLLSAAAAAVYLLLSTAVAARSHIEPTKTTTTTATTTAAVALSLSLSLCVSPISFSPPRRQPVIAALYVAHSFLWHACNTWPRHGSVFSDWWRGRVRVLYRMVDGAEP